jgi:hypothetical protein
LDIVVSAPLRPDNEIDASVIDLSTERRETQLGEFHFDQVLSVPA